MKDINLAKIIILCLAVVKYIMMIQSLELPVKILNATKKTENGWLRILKIRAGILLDCTACLSVIGAILAVVIDMMGLTLINTVFAISILGLILKRKYL